MILQKYITLKKRSLRWAFILLFITTSGLNALSIPLKWPKKVSEFNGWQNIKLIKGKRCPVCYSLVFSKDFGLNNNKEFLILINLPEKRISKDIEYDLDGPLFADNDVLDHLLFLALEKQSAKAAKIILYPKKHSLHLGIETSEEEVGKYIIPLLNGYYNLNEIIKESEYELIGKWISRWSAYRADFHSADKLVTVLMKKNYIEFASIISKMCLKEKALMKKYGEDFFE